MRAAKAMEFLTGGYHLTPDDVIGSGVFCEGTENNMVIVRDIDVHSLCEHHLLPFSGKVRSICVFYVAFIPKNYLLIFRALNTYRCMWGT